MMTARSSRQSSPMRDRCPLRIADTRSVDDAAFAEDGVLDVGGEDLGAGKEPGVGEDRPLLVVEVEFRQGRARSMWASKKFRIVPISSQYPSKKWPQTFLSPIAWG